MNPSGGQPHGWTGVWRGRLILQYTRPMTKRELELITVDPEVLHGQAHIRGTRIPVALVLGCLADGMTEDDILADYPTLTVEGIRAAAAYGAALASEDVLPPSPR
jgi:uncharacterized protein (DUF433 family)